MTDPVKVKEELEARAEERRKETTHHEALLSGFLETSEDPAAEKPMDEQVREETAGPATAVLASKDKEITAEEPVVSRKEIDEKFEELEERLMEKLKAANTGCKCTIA